METVHASAIAYKAEHPEISYGKLSKMFKVPKTTIIARCKGQRTSSKLAAQTKLSHAEEMVLISKINLHASRGTLLEPRHLRSMAEAIYGDKLGVNWVSNFIKRHKSEITSDYFSYTERLRVKADTPEVRHAFYDLVGFVVFPDRPAHTTGEISLRKTSSETTQHLQYG